MSAWRLSCNTQRLSTAFRHKTVFLPITTSGTPVLQQLLNAKSTINLLRGLDVVGFQAILVALHVLQDERLDVADGHHGRRDHHGLARA